jgi:hypothetical protein
MRSISLLGVRFGRGHKRVAAVLAGGDFQQLSTRDEGTEGVVSTRRVETRAGNITTVGVFAPFALLPTEGQRGL